jgi:cell division protein FtsB
MMKSLIRIINFATPILLVALICFCASILYPEYKKTQKVRGNLGQLKAEKLRRQGENDSLRRELANMDTPEYIIKTAREELNLVRPGETIVEFDQGRR